MNGSQEKYSSNHNNVNMHHLRSLEGFYLQESFITIGSFDGVHRGHQEIIKKLVDRAEKVKTPSVVITFFPHPAVVLGKRKDPFYLTTPEERAQLLDEMGVNYVITLPFNHNVASMTARNFTEWLVNHLHPRLLCVGHDFALGKNRVGDVEYLSNLGAEFGYQVELIEPVANSDVVISSSTIRSKITSGELELASLLLGRSYRIWGEIVTGEGRGKTIGIPTANLRVWAKRVLPKAGVYVAKTQILKKNYGAVVNIGVRPTFEEALVTPRVEAHILEYVGDIYGEQIHLDVIKRLRDERRFSSAGELVDQIKKDINQAQKILTA